MAMIIGGMSLNVKNGWKVVFDIGDVGSPSILLAPFSWISTMCKIVRNVRVRGRMKWRPKNRDSVGASTEYPPHNHLTSVSPAYGIADIKFVITEAPQKDICPHGKT